MTWLKKSAKISDSKMTDFPPPSQMSKYSPAHYQRGKIEVWDFIADQQLGYLEGNVIKYICRAGHKAHESSLDDLLKAQAYINKLVSITQHVEPPAASR